MVDHPMPRNTTLHILRKFFALDFVLLPVPSQLLQIQIYEIFEILLFRVDAAKHKHILPHQCDPMVSSTLDRFLVAHLEGPAAPALQIDEVDRIVADSALPADVVHPHSSENDDEPALVDDGRVVAPGGGERKLFGPSAALERENLCKAERSTAMPSDYHRHIFVAGGSVPLPRFRLPSLERIVPSGQHILNVFGSPLDCRFLDHLSYLGVEGWQPLLLVVVDVEDLLVFERLFDVVVQLLFPHVGKLGLDAGAVQLVLLQQLQQTPVALLEGALVSSDPTPVSVLITPTKLDFVEIVEALVNGGDEGVFFDGGVSPGVPLGQCHIWKGIRIINKLYNNIAKAMCLIGE